MSPHIMLRQPRKQIMSKWRFHRSLGCNWTICLTADNSQTNQPIKVLFRCFWQSHITSHLFHIVLEASAYRPSYLPETHTEPCFV